MSGFFLIGYTIYNIDNKSRAVNTNWKKSNWFKESLIDAIITWVYLLFNNWLKIDSREFFIGIQLHWEISETKRNYRSLS